MGLCCSTNDKNSTLTMQGLGGLKKKDINSLKNQKDYTQFQRSGKLAMETDPFQHSDSFIKEQMYRRETIQIRKISNTHDPDVDAPNFIKKIATDNIKDIYKMGKLIGSGNFGTVRLASPHSNPHKVFAIKSIPREKIEDELELLE